MKKISAENHRIFCKFIWAFSWANVLKVMFTILNWWIWFRRRIKCEDEELEILLVTKHKKRSQNLGESLKVILKRVKSETSDCRKTGGICKRIIFHHANARPHVARSIKKYSENSGWEVLPHPPYSPDHASFDYHMFRSMQNVLTWLRFTIHGGNSVLKIGLNYSWSPFFWDEIYK